MASKRARDKMDSGMDMASSSVVMLGYLDFSIFGIILKIFTLLKELDELLEGDEEEDLEEDFLAFIRISSWNMKYFHSFHQVLTSVNRCS